MSELIIVNLSTRNTKPKTGVCGFDTDDIVVPIRFGANNKSYFTARQLKGSKDGGSDNNGRADYEVTDTLASINSQSDRLAILTVKFRRNTDMHQEKMIFVLSRISESIVPTPILGLGTGSSFFYVEDGDPQPVEYVVLESVATIVAGKGGGGGGTGNVTTINYDLAGTGVIDLTGYFGAMVINLTDTGGIFALNNITNAAGVTKITIYPDNTCAPLTVNDGALNIKLNAPALSVFGNLLGFLELTARNSKFFQTNYIDQYNP